MNDLGKVTLRKEGFKNDALKIEHLQNFMLNWETVLSGLNETPSELTLQAMFAERIRDYPDLAVDIGTFDRSEPGTKERDPMNFFVKQLIDF